MATESTIPTVSAGAGRVCRHCGAEAAGHFCPACGKVQPPYAVDHFTFFSLPRKLNLDTAALEREFYRLSRRLHPDLYARAGGEEQRWSLEKSSQLNDAYRTLKAPIARTEYLLELEGVQLEEQSKQATEQAREAGKDKKQIVPPDLLEEVFELNMQLEELRASKKMGEDDAQLRADLEQHRKNLEAKMQELESELQGHWDAWDALIERERSGEQVEQQERARIRDGMVDLLNRRNYVRNLVRDVAEAMG